MLSPYGQRGFDVFLAIDGTPVDLRRRHEEVRNAALLRYELTYRDGTLKVNGRISTAYGHNTSVAVGVGQQVAQGQLIAYSGNTGHSTGPHVHFEVRINGSAVDPMGYL